MKNSIAYRKGIVLILATVFWVFGLQGVGYSQVDMATVQVSSGEQIYAKAIRSVMWIITDDAQASAVLIDKKRKFAVTNEHVTKNHAFVRVVFPVRDASGALVSERNFYVDRSKQGVLERLGYATKGRVIAEDAKRDLAIVQLEGIPETAREIDHDFNNQTYYEMKHREPVAILGNPGGRDLWRWTAGHFGEINQELLHINAGTYGGNSGGPVLNEQGMLIGIIKSSDRLMNTYAVPLEYISDLLKALTLIQVFAIQNNNTFTVPYQIQWTKYMEWKQYYAEPDGWRIHWNSESLRQKDYPKIRFDHIVNDKIATYKYYNLETYIRIFGTDIKERISREDAHKYRFGYNARSKKLDLYNLEKK